MLAQRTHCATQQHTAGHSTAQHAARQYELQTIRQKQPHQHNTEKNSCLHLTWPRKHFGLLKTKSNLASQAAPTSCPNINMGLDTSTLLQVVYAKGTGDSACAVQRGLNTHSCNLAGLQTQHRHHQTGRPERKTQHTWQHDNNISSSSSSVKGSAVRADFLHLLTGRGAAGAYYVHTSCLTLL